MSLFSKLKDIREKHEAYKQKRQEREIEDIGRKTKLFQAKQRLEREKTALARTKAQRSKLNKEKWSAFTGSFAGSTPSKKSNSFNPFGSSSSFNAFASPAKNSNPYMQNIFGTSSSRRVAVKKRRSVRRYR